jgi:hypothetical protein
MEPVEGIHIGQPSADTAVWKRVKNGSGRETRMSHIKTEHLTMLNINNSTVEIR